MKHLTPGQTGTLHDLLWAREQQLAAEVDAALARRAERDDAGREIDAGVVDQQSALELADLLRDQQELDAVRAALGRIDRGTFGRCLSCGVHIPIERLRVQPHAAYCHVCQTRAEGDSATGFGV